MKYFLILLIACTLQANSQTVTTIINYQTWTGATGCNIFSSPTTINSVVHLSTVGQPTYDATNHAGVLTGQVTSTGSILGTEYRIAYNFKSGYSYSFTVNAQSIISQGGLPNLRLRLTGSTGTSTSCNSGSTIDQALSGNLTYSNSINNVAFTNYSYPLGTLSSNVPYLTVALIPVTGGGYETILIRSITITETAVAPELVLSPTSLPVACGTTKTQTFTVTNPNNVSGITGYNWNIGAAPNGWLYNGVAAPATISTTTNSISLTSICGIVPKNISVNVMKGSTVYKTYMSSIVNTQQAYTITGNDPLCTATGQYTVSPALCGATYSWTSSYTNIATVSASGNPVTVTKVGNGGTTLTAKISNGCTGGLITVTKSIKVGSTSSSFTVSGPSSSCPNRTQYYSTNAPVGNITWSWPSDWSYQYGQNSTTLTIITGNSSGSVSVSVPNGCSGTSNASTYTQINALNCGFGITATPNPTTDNVTIAVADQEGIASSKKTKAKMYHVKVTDQFGNVKKQYKYSSGASNTNISLGGLMKGMYTIQAFDGTSWSSTKVIKQ